MPEIDRPGEIQRYRAPSYRELLGLLQEPEPVRRGITLMSHYESAFRDGHYEGLLEINRDEELLEHLTRLVCDFHPNKIKIRKVLGENKLPPQLAYLIGTVPNIPGTIHAPEIKHIIGHPYLAILALVLGPEHQPLYQAFTGDSMGHIEGSPYVTAEGIAKHPEKGGSGWFSYNAAHIDERGREVPAKLPVIVLPSGDLYREMGIYTPLEQIRAERIANALNPFIGFPIKGIGMAVSHKIVGLVARWLIDENTRPEVGLEVFKGIVEGVFGENHFVGMSPTEKEGVLAAQATPLLRAYEKLRGSNVPPGDIIRGLMRGDPIYMIAQGLIHR